MGSEVIRTIRNTKYLYYVYYDNKERKEIYCGRLSDPDSKNKAQSAELCDLQSQRERISKRIKELKI